MEAKYITNLKGKYIDAQKGHDVKAEDTVDEDETLLAQRQKLEQIKFQLDQLKERSTSHHNELFAKPFYLIGQGKQMKLYTQAELEDRNMSEDLGEIYSQTWYIMNYNNDVVELRAGGNVIGKVPGGLPAFRLPTFEWTAILHLIGAAIAISLIGFMEAISIAKAMAARTRQDLDVNRELIGQGMSNILGSMFQSYPVSGSFSRSAVNINAGAVTGFSSIITVIAVAITLLFLTPLFYYLPQATLAAVIMMAVVGLISFKPIIHAWQVNRHDGIVAVVAFVFTLALAPELEMGILFGMLLSLVLLLFRIMKPRVSFPPLDAHQLPPDAVVAGIIDDKRIVRMRFEGSLVFANVAFFEQQLHKLLASTPQLKVLIIDAVSINEVDASGDQMLRDYFERLNDSGVYVLFTRVRKPIMHMFSRSHMHDDIGLEYFHRNPVKVLKHAWALIVANSDAEQQGVTESEVDKTG